jgi:hypothetical protein
VSGVEVHLTAIDPNGNFQDIGTAVSDVAGNFAVSWTPPVEGTYHVTAEFAGSAAYGSSFATTYFEVALPTVVLPNVEPTVQPTQTAAPTPAQPTPTPVAPSPTVAPPPQSAEPTTTYLAIGAAAIIIVAAAAALVLRKRK